MHFVIIDDSKTILLEYSLLLKQAGHEVTGFSSSNEALEQIIKLQPDCVVCDLLLPGMDGLELFKRIRNEEHIKQPVFIVVSGKQFEYDRRRALELGVDAYLTKPINPDTFAAELTAIVDGHMTIEFWGVRGTLPVPGQKSLRYGGNTNCITLNIANKQNYIFDAGTGIKELSNYILKEKKLPYKAKIFISHPHYDHINGIPFFVPLYMKGNEFQFFGADHAELSFEKLMSNQMDSVYFPVTMDEFSSTVSFRSLTEEKFKLDDVDVETLLLNHPGRCLGYKLVYKNKIFCYITDNEIYPKDDKKRYNQEEVDRLISFMKDADIVIIDATYTDAEYPRKIGWGHSSLTSVVDVAHKANVKLLCLHHHDPDQSDEDIDAKLHQAEAMLKEWNSTTRCIIPHEGDKIVI